MSQKKVDQYKKEKANRQKIMKREKWIRRIGVTVAAVVLVGLVGWFCVAVYNNSKSVSEDNTPTETTNLYTSDLENYVTEINSDSSESAETTDTTAASETEDTTATSEAADTTATSEAADTAASSTSAE